ncbi:uncharacterized protein LOC130622946 [Hydractinia symbiolongicarpus]|uniref:uncharacterized protein LOC130622946 n=1 Tax=Hydractinia symbiolongicarpus TaxID=13093 RepID=UPI00254D1224|nr:uncharacterized protein LOC130622946 [Hydractinia symbiolongicarpus]
MMLKENEWAWNQYEKSKLHADENTNALLRDDALGFTTPKSSKFPVVDRATTSLKADVIIHPKSVGKSHRSHRSPSTRSKETRSSGRSQVSSLRSRAADQKAELAQLKTKASFLEAKLEAEASMKRLELKEQVALAEAKLSIYEEAKDEDEKSHFSRPLDTDDEQIRSYAKCQSWVNNGCIGVIGSGYEGARSHPKLVKKIPKFLPDVPQNTAQPQVVDNSVDVNKDWNINNEQESLNPFGNNTERVLCELLLQQSAPDIKIDPFDGNVLDFQYFMTTFEAVVETKIKSNKGRLTRLINYTTGEPKELIKSCIYDTSEHCYSRAKDLLKKTYGDQFRIANAYRKELREWPTLRAGDSEAFRKFYTFLIKCYGGLERQIKSELTSPEVLRQLQSKLPQALQQRWNRTVLNVRRKNHHEAELRDFVDFMEQETTLENDPLYSREAISELKNKKDNDVKNKKDPPKLETNLTGVTRDCLYCSNKHKLEDCRKIMKIDVEERNKFVWEKKLCFACLEPITSNHQARNCENKLSCKTCKKRHPTILHGFIRPKRTNKNDKENNDKKEGEEPEISNAFARTKKSVCCKTDNNVEIISMSVVPVVLSHPKSAESITTYAMLDNCSQGTFITDEIVHRLNLTGISSTIVVKTLTSESREDSCLITGLMVEPITRDFKVTIQSCYSRRHLPIDPMEIPTPEKVAEWPHLRHIKHSFHKYDPGIPIGLLIGANCPQALEPIKVIPSDGNGPYGLKTRLGWSLVGPLLRRKGEKQKIRCNRIAVKDSSTDKVAALHLIQQDELRDVTIEGMLKRMYDADFSEMNAFKNIKSDYVSIHDQKFLSLMEKEVKFVNGKYQLPLPLINQLPFPNNKCQALARLKWIKKNLESNSIFKEDYLTFMNNLTTQGFAEMVPKQEVKGEPGHVWYIPHHGVYHPRKPGKIRVVFDCTATYKGVSLNGRLMQGPDMTNLLVGILCRFRLEPVAFMADIESMFYQVKVPPNQRDYLRYLWWPDGDTSKDLVDHRMTVHIFGGNSSPSCSNYALKRSGTDNESEFGEEAVKVIMKDFYVDDLLKSVKSIEEAIKIIKSAIQICSKGGFRLTKFISNSREVINSIPTKERAKNIKSLDLKNESLPIERALGVHWSIEDDKLGFRITMQDKPLSKRGVLATISSIYDPLGLAAPFLLKGRKIMQNLCKEKTSWDEKISEPLRSAWERWRLDIVLLKKLEVNRCVKPLHFKEIESTSLHHFSDASNEGYGTATYLRIRDVEGNVNCCLLLGKSRVAPIKMVSIPRLELTAATVAVKVGVMLKQEMPAVDYECYWTDSNVVLGYINNESRRFHIFVANRIQQIQENTSLDQWNHVPTHENPADDASRGISLKHVEKSSRWFKGPQFLWEEREAWPAAYDPAKNSVTDDPEFKRSVSVFVSATDSGILCTFERRISRLQKCIRVMALVGRFIDILKMKIKAPSHGMTRRSQKASPPVLCVEDLQRAEKCLIKLVQQQHFASEIKALASKEWRQDRRNDKIKKSALKECSKLYKLSPFIDDDGILRVGGRLCNMDEAYQFKYPAILPKESWFSELVLRWCHENTHHSGRGITLQEIQQRGYWIIHINSAVRQLIHHCVRCRILRGRAGQQVMADLPKDRVDACPPFTYCAVDLFGPLVIKPYRKFVKRYGCLFTCLASRAVHIEVVNTLETDSFILALRRFVARRGNIRTMRSDNGTNFVGTETEFIKALKQMDNAKVKQFLQSVGCDWILWKRNTPAASHMGGVWERQIRSVRAILKDLFNHNGSRLSEESLHTILTEAESIVNSRPLCVEAISDANSATPISPLALLTMKSKVVLPPPGNFEEASLYCRKQWKRAQYVLDMFWRRWKCEYLCSLQTRTKWNKNERNFAAGDIVMVQNEDCERGRWPLARVVAVKTSADGKVRSCSVKLGSRAGTILDRPITKLIQLLEYRIPDEEPQFSR